MAYNTWGGSWGTSWGTSWTRGDAPPIVPPTGGGGSSHGPVYYEPKRKEVVRLRKIVRKRVEEAVNEQPYGHLFGYDDLISVAVTEVRRVEPGFMSETMIHEIAERAIKGIHAALLKRQADDEDDEEFLLLVA